MCDRSNKENGFVLHTKQNRTETSSEKVYWILSNYSTHVQNHVKNSKFPTNLVTNSSTKNDSAIEVFHCENRKLANTMEHTNGEFNGFDDPDLIAEYIEDEESGDGDEHTDDRSIEIIEIYSTPQSNSGLSYDELESLIYNQITPQLNEMRDVSIKNREIDKKMKFMVGDVVCTMTVNATNPDGACFFRACDHQLNKNKLNSRKHTLGTNNLRKDVVKYIKQHRDSFDAELRGSVYGWYESIGRCTKNIENFEKVCDDYLHKELPKAKFWAGSESAKAIILIKSVNMLILVDGKCYFLNGFDENLTKTIILAYCTYSNGAQPTNWTVKSNTESL